MALGTVPSTEHGLEQRVLLMSALLLCQPGGLWVQAGATFYVPSCPVPQFQRRNRASTITVSTHVPQEEPAACALPCQPAPA